MTHNGVQSYVELNDEVRALRERLALLESTANRSHAEAPESLRLIGMAVDHLPQSICWKDRNSVFLGCNQPFAQNVGLAHPRDIVGKTDYDLTSAELAAAYCADDRRVMEGGVAKVNFEERQLHPDGTLGWLLTSKIPLREQDGRVVGVLVTLEDITERKRAEEERARTQDEYIQMQAGLLAELSTPLIPITQAVVVMPLIGSIDSRRAQQVLDTLLHGISERGARIAILDITGVPIVDTHVAGALIRAAQSAQLLGAQVVLTGIRPEVAQTLVGMGTELHGIVTRSDLQSGIAFATHYR
jgi:PAS domain S-box-containing protein